MLSEPQPRRNTSRQRLVFVKDRRASKFTPQRDKKIKKNKGQNCHFTGYGGIWRITQRFSNSWDILPSHPDQIASVCARGFWGVGKLSKCSTSIGTEDYGGIQLSQVGTQKHTPFHCIPPPKIIQHTLMIQGLQSPRYTLVQGKGGGANAHVCAVDTITQKPPQRLSSPMCGCVRVG